MTRVLVALTSWFAGRLLAALAFNVWDVSVDPILYFSFSFLFSYVCILHFGAGLTGLTRFTQTHFVLGLALFTCLLELTIPTNNGWWSELGLNVRVLCAVVVGLWIGRRVERASYIWPLVLVGLTLDVVSLAFSSSFTHSVVQSVTEVPERLHPLLVYTPAQGLQMPLFGLADLAFSMILVSATHGLKLMKARLTIGLSLGCIIGMSLVIWTASPVPLLPFLGVFGALSLGKSIQPTRRDLIQTLGFLLVAISICAVLWAK
jgi:hypothetical protein